MSWAQRAQQASTAPPRAITPTPTPTPSTSKSTKSSNSSSSDNWRSPSTNSANSIPTQSKSNGKNQSSGKDKEQKISKVIEIKKEVTTSWSADVDDSLPSLPSPFFEPTLKSNPTQEESISNNTTSTIVTPETTSTQTSSTLDSISSETTSETAPSEVASTAASTSASTDVWTTVQPKSKVNAPTPKVNVWSIRKDQLASAGTSNSSGNSNGGGSGKGQGRESNRQSKSSEGNGKPGNGKVRNSSATKEVKEVKEIIKEVEVVKDLTVAVSAPATTKVVAESIPPISKKLPEGWKAPTAPTAIVSSTVTPDKESWPSPLEEVKKGKEKLKKVEEVDDGLPKKKADKTKWIPIKADITVTSTGPTTRYSAGSSSIPSSNNDKKKRASNTEANSRSRRNSAETKASNSTKKASKPTTATEGSNVGAEKKTSAIAEGKKVGKEGTKVNSVPLNGVVVGKKATAKPSTTKVEVLTTETPLESTVIPETEPESIEPTIAIEPNASSTATNAAISTSPSALEASTTTPAISNQNFRTNNIRGGRPQQSSTRGSNSNRGTNSNRNNYSNNRQQLPIDSNQYNFESQVPFYGNGFGAQANNAQMIGHQVLDPYSLGPTQYWLLGQIEYYFSFDNLCRDMFLRSKMDDQGWLNISLIASFARIKNLSTDLNIIRETMTLTPLLELKGNFVRLRTVWSEWLLPGALPSTVDSVVEAEFSSLEIGSPKPTPRSLPTEEKFENGEKVVVLVEQEVQTIEISTQ